MTTAKIKSAAIVFEPIAPAAANPGELYRDSSGGDALTEKTAGGDDQAVGAASSADVMVKVMQNLSALDIQPGTPVSKMSNGSAVVADADGDAGQLNVIGVALDLIAANGGTGRVGLAGPNIVNAIQGLGIAPGADVYLSKTGSYTADAGSFSPSVDTIVKMGVADCAAGNASGVATDLIMFAEVISRPQ